MPGGAGQGASLSVNLTVSRQLGQKYRRLGDEVTVEESEDGEGGDDDGQALPVDEGTQ